MAAVGPAEGADPARGGTHRARRSCCPRSGPSRGSSSADLTGGTTQRLLITLDPAKMADAGVSLQQIQGVLQANQLTLPAGQPRRRRIAAARDGTLITTLELARAARASSW